MDTKLEKRYPDNKWDSLADYLAGTHVLYNDDYLDFLVSRVWRIDKPCRIVDFGCGTGQFGLRLMPLLPEGSTYTGFDQSSVLIDEARRIYDGSPYDAEFSVGSVHSAPFSDNTFDVAVCKGVLMHVPNPLDAIREMIRVTRDGGMVITCEGNRNAANALMHIEELDSQDTTSLGMLQTINREIRRQTGVDHNIGIKIPVLMHKAGLKNIEARVDDSVRLILPPLDTQYKEAVFRAICDQGYVSSEISDEKRAEWKAGLVKYGISEETAEMEIDTALAQDIPNKGRSYHIVYPMLVSFSFGTVNKSVA